ncbi:MAG: tryptophanyl-tRNA synthetase [Microgenomates bacterium 39_7]|nr:MAG: tryptophanyl-tRNA synthetase [Microgenomates bacterium 39_7]
MSQQQRVFSGTRATGRLHLGNYLGAIKGYLELTANPDYECIFMVMDLHAITTPYDHSVLPSATREIVLDYLAAGLDPKKAIITTQSLMVEHPYLAFLLSSVMTVARMQHLPTFKEKANQYPENVTMGLLNYPLLMAADILLYKAQLVPVGIDQEPHLEVAREVARKMNEKFGLDFPEPVRFATTGEYVPSLKGEGKMSKSVEGSYINLTDNLEEILNKLKGAPTDSGKGTIQDNQSDSNSPRTSISNKYRFIDGQSGQNSPGVVNLLTFVELFEGKAKREHYQDLYQTDGIKYGQLKKELAEAIYQELKPIQEKRQELEKQPEYIDQIIKEGAKKASAIASETLSQVREAMGLTTNY